MTAAAPTAMNASRSMSCPSLALLTAEVLVAVTALVDEETAG